VSCRTSRATSTTQTRETLRLSSSDGVDTVYATHLPSGESCGSLTALRAMLVFEGDGTFWAASGAAINSSKTGKRIQYSGE